MKLQEIISQQAITADIQSTERDEAIVELVELLLAAGVAPKTAKDDLVKSIIDRESKGSTGFGKGVAVPHVKHAKVKKMAVAVGISQKGVDFNALDKQPVYSVMLVLSPADQPDLHIQAMHVIFNSLTNDTFRKFLKQATKPQHVWDLILETDAGVIK
jgi:mannitol/fructose-specific phosphotransferase system IIA component (Ntr-type)